MKKVLSLALAVVPAWLAVSECVLPAPAASALEGIPPPPEKALSITDPEHTSIKALVSRLAELSGFAVTFDARAEELLAERPVAIGGGFTLERHTAWPAAETLLHHASCSLLESDGGFLVEGPRAFFSDGIAPRRVRLSELPDYASHPAVYVELEFDVPGLIHMISSDRSKIWRLGLVNGSRRCEVVYPEDQPPRLRFSGGASWVADRAALLVDFGATEFVAIEEPASTTETMEEK